MEPNLRLQLIIFLYARYEHQVKKLIQEAANYEPVGIFDRRPLELANELEVTGNLMTELLTEYNRLTTGPVAEA